MSTFGDIRSALHANDEQSVIRLIRDYRGEFSEAEAIARYFVDMCDEFPRNFSGFIWSRKSTLDMQVGFHRVTLMKITNHAAQSVFLPFRREVEQSTSDWTVHPELAGGSICDNIESWLKEPDDEVWEYVRKGLNYCKGRIGNPYKSWPLLYTGKNLNNFFRNHFERIDGISAAERKSVRLGVNRFLLKEYVCPPSVT